MKKILNMTLLITVSSLLTGCLFFNERGVASKYYDECKHYYDAQGIFHEKCDENIVDYENLEHLVKQNGSGGYYVEF